MNSKKYKDVLYPTREVKDLRELVYSSASLYPKKTAYLVKERPGGKYKPVKYCRVKADMECLGTGFHKLGLCSKKIAVIGENSYEWVLTYLATVNGTGVIVPLDRELPINELIGLLQRAKVSAIVYSKKCTKSVMEAVSQVEGIEYTICMKEDRDEQSLWLHDVMELGREALVAGDRRFKDAKIDPDAMCTLMFTSGTTGLAKGVMLSHKNIVSNVVNMSKYVKIKEDGVGLSVLPMHHAYEMTCHIFTAFYQGVTVAICEGLKYISKNMAEAKVTVMLGVPLIFENMQKKVMKSAAAKGKLEQMQKMMELSKKTKLYNNQMVMRKMFASVHEATGGHVDLFIAGGAAINPKVIEDFQALGFPMIQGYGMSENAPIISVNRDRYSKPASVGQPLPGTKVKIIDKDERGIGEIIVKGPSIMLGYYENPEATAEAIRDGWLYTGDYGYMDSDGYLYISGRKKNVIVTKNGKNIFPEEIEALLSETEYIAECLVHGVPDEKSGDTIVKAEVYPDYNLIRSDLGNLTEAEIERLMNRLVDDVNDKMPAYKRVARVGVRKTEFEKTTTRKVKRHTQGNLGPQ